jgi:hypothetical protein
MPEEVLLGPKRKVAEQVLLQNKQVASESQQPTSGNSIPIPETLHGAHPLIGRTRKLLESNKADRTGLVEIPWREKVLSVTVSKALSHRALRWLDALLKALEARGGKFVKAEDTEDMELKIGEDEVAFSLIEEVDRTERQPKNEEERKSYSWQHNKWEFKPSGRLKFMIHQRQPIGGRKSWADCTRHKLEEKIEEILGWMLTTAEAEKKERLKWEERRRRWAIEQQQEEAAEKRRQIEEGNQKRLEENAKLRDKAKKLRSFIWACEMMLKEGRKELPGDGWELRWLTWARKHADRIDPLTNGYLESERKRLKGVSTDESDQL